LIGDQADWSLIGGGKTGPKRQHFQRSGSHWLFTILSA